MSNCSIATDLCAIDWLVPGWLAGDCLPAWVLGLTGDRLPGGGRGGACDRVCVCMCL